jgi:hypothetical protein
LAKVLAVLICFKFPLFTKKCQNPIAIKQIDNFPRSEYLNNCFPMLFNYSFCNRVLFNPWNHRADISAQAYLKPSKKGKKMSPNCFFQTHYKEFCGDSEKNTHLFVGYLVRILRGVDFLSRSFTSG